MTAPRRRLIVKELREQFHVSQHRASRALDLARSSLRYAPVLRDEQAALARRIEELAGRTRGTATGGSGPSWIARAGRSTRRRFVASGVSRG